MIRRQTARGLFPQKQTPWHSRYWLPVTENRENLSRHICRNSCWLICRWEGSFGLATNSGTGKALAGPAHLEAGETFTGPGSWEINSWPRNRLKNRWEEGHCEHHFFVGGFMKEWLQEILVGRIRWETARFNALPSKQLSEASRPNGKIGSRFTLTASC